MCMHIHSDFVFLIKMQDAVEMLLCPGWSVLSEEACLDLSCQKAEQMVNDIHNLWHRVYSANTEQDIPSYSCKHTYIEVSHIHNSAQWMSNSYLHTRLINTMSICPCQHILVPNFTSGQSPRLVVPWMLNISTICTSEVQVCSHIYMIPPKWCVNVRKYKKICYLDVCIF